MFGSIGGPELILIFIVALLVFGPRRLPEIGRKVGGVVRDLRRATTDFRSNLEQEIGVDPMTGLEKAGRMRRDILTAVGEPIRDMAEGTVGSIREARDATRRALTGAAIAGTPRSDPPPGAAGYPRPGAPARPSPVAPGSESVDAQAPLPLAGPVQGPDPSEDADGSGGAGA